MAKDEISRDEVAELLETNKRDLETSIQAKRPSRRPKRKRSKYKPKPFESYPAAVDPKRSYDTSANIYESMMLSKAWIDLTPAQKVLYQVCKSQMYAQKHRPSLEMENVSETSFFMNRWLWQTTYQLYKPGNEKGFYRDMTALIDHGFIRCVYSGANSKDKSVYDYSDKWRWYGESIFQIPQEDKTPAMLFKEHKKKPDNGE